jgi:hypothetical protein
MLENPIVLVAMGHTLTSSLEPRDRRPEQRAPHRVRQNASRVLAWAYRKRGFGCLGERGNCAIVLA